ncbi:hypothetical protein [Phenylobacterium aquaticum]|uniref:hypothetical protein n=1 Tax=Phenylobacterium aquaticum TaxID=1763816 RepID=UPI001F5C589D|nr:hypothetical protein [Phenylobacterium aquaticum]MCI3134979.1 hypothetical protein [Phenylobacterium aquaticum]
MGMDYVAIGPERRRAPLHLRVMTGLEIAALAPAVYVALQALALALAQVADDHRAVIAFVAAMAFPVALILGPLFAWFAFRRRADDLIWPLLWSPYIWPVLIIAACLA